MTAFLTPGRSRLAGLLALVGGVGLTLTVADRSLPTVAADPARSDSAMFGGTPARNMVNLVDKGVPAKFGVDDGSSVLWKADLGSKAYGGPTIAGGRVYVGTNNQKPRNERDVARNKEGEIEPIDKGVLMCFDEKSGKFLWQAVHAKLESGRVNDWPEEGVCSTPTVDGDKVYYVSNRCAVVCLDAAGLANGNQGVQGEKLKDDTDADVLWEFDMMKELRVFPHNMSAGCPLVVGDVLYVITGNGVDDGHINIPSPEAPSFIALDKNTGKLLWKNNAPGKNVMHGQWSNPAYAEINGVRQIVFGGGDGWLRGFVPETGEELWRFDANPKDAVYELGGTGTRSDFIGTPVVYDNKIYIGVGQDPEHSTGVAHFWCVSPTKKGDISPTVEAGKTADGKPAEKPNPNACVAWHFGGEETRKWSQREFKFGRTMSTACIVDDILYISELQGYLHCMNAKTGEHYWQYDTKASIWGSPYYADGKVFLATDSGDLFAFKHEKAPKTFDELDIQAANLKDARLKIKDKRKQLEDAVLLGKTEFDAPIRSTPIVANGVVYVMTEKTLYALKTK